MIRGENRGICGSYLKPITLHNSLKTYSLKHRHNKRREKRYMWWLYIYTQPKTSTDNSMKTHRLKHRHDKGREKRYVHGGYLQPITSNSTMKTHPLKHRHDKRRKRDMW